MGPNDGFPTWQAGDTPSDESHLDEWLGYGDHDDIDDEFDDEDLAREEAHLWRDSARLREEHREAVREEYARMELGLGQARTVNVNKAEWDRFAKLARQPNRGNRSNSRRRGASSVAPYPTARPRSITGVGGRGSPSPGAKLKSAASQKRATGTDEDGGLASQVSFTSYPWAWDWTSLVQPR